MKTSSGPMRRLSGVIIEKNVCKTLGIRGAQGSTPTSLEEIQFKHKKRGG
jgi:hypothetical protein